MKKTVSILFAVLFLALCLLPSAGLALHGPAEAAANEVLASAPALRGRDGRVNTAFLSDFAAYVRDRFFLRQQAITAWNGLNVSLLRSSPAADVLAGEDGWLYYTDTLPDYTGSEPLTERELWCAAETVSLMAERTRSLSADFLFVICPDKNSLYPEHMPARLRGLQSREESSAARLLEALAERDVPAVDLFSAFTAQDETLYFRTDSHWNARGAALGADAILTALGRPGGWFEGGFAAGEPHRGDLYEMLYPARAAAEPDLAPAAPFTFTYLRPFRAVNDITIETEADAAGSLVMFRDSFGNSLYPYLAERFGHAVFSRHTVYDLSLLENYEADTLVVELVERNLRYLLRYTPVLPAPVRTLDLPTAEVREALAVTVESSPLEGCALLGGTLPGDADADSPLWLLADGILREATPRPDSFAAHLPLNVDALPTLQLVYYADGQPVLRDLRPAE